MGRVANVAAMVIGEGGADDTGLVILLSRSRWTHSP